MANQSPMDDTAALGHYATKRDPEAFAWLVRRHIDAVYASARRQVNDEALAQDVTQAVFFLLSQSAARLSRKTILIGWLLKATHFICRDARKREARRRFHETKATLMRETRSDMPDQGADADWGAIRPHLDEALMTLGTTNRSALAMRYLENRPLKEIGQTLGISEEAARKRVDRALDHLRKTLLVNRIVTPAALGATLLAKSAQAAPATLTASVLAPATKGATALAIGGARLLFWTRLKFAAAVAAAFLVLATGAAVAFQIAAQRNSPAASAAAAVAAAPPSTTLPDAPAVAQPITYQGHLFDPSGNPASIATIRVYLSNNISDNLEWQGKLAADGSFTIGPLPPDPEFLKRILLFDAPGYALTLLPTQSFTWFDDPANIRITLQKAAPVSGIITDVRGNPIEDATVEATVTPQDRLMTRQYTFKFNQQTGLAVKSDKQGKFHFDRIPENDRLHLTVHHPAYRTWTTDTISYAASDSPIAAGTDDVDIQLKDGPATLRAQITRDGNPLARAGLWVAATGDHRQETAQTDAAGRVEFTGLEPGEWALSPPYFPNYSGPLFVSITGTILQPGDERAYSLKIGSIPVHGIEVDDDTHLPARGAITVGTTVGENYLGELKPDASGHFDCLLPPGTYHLSWIVWDNGQEQSVTQDFTPSPDNPNLTLTVHSHDWPSLRGQLVDDAGNPVAGRIDLGGNNSATAGPDGRFTIGVSPYSHGQETTLEAIDISRRLHGFALVNPSKTESREIRMVLKPMATIIGQAVDRAGHPLRGAQVEVWNQQADGVESNGFNFNATVNPDGTFRIGPITLGHHLSIHLRDQDDWASVPIPSITPKPGGRTRLGEELYDFADDGLKPGETRNLGQIVLNPAGDPKMQIDPQFAAPPRQPWDAAITGRMLDRAGKPVVGLTLSANIAVPDIVQFAVTDLKGRFAIRGLPRNRSIELQSQKGVWAVTTPATAIDLTLPLPKQPAFPSLP